MYTHLFDKAWKILEEKAPDKLTDAEKKAGKFTSLEQYFAHMADLVSFDPVYMMLPLDEGTEGIFTINANDRTISIPTQFAKCAAVKDDNFCEIAVFTVDRFYDFQDLNGTQICVQWINAAGEEGISNILLRDCETYPGKLRFGWPLTSNITKQAGQVQFAVRFYITVDDPDDIDGDGKTKISYVLNTLQHSLTIKPNLTIDRENIIPEQVGRDIFSKFVKNSQNPTFKIPATPIFGAPGKDLVNYGAISLDSDDLTLEAQAITSDLGSIDYTWKFRPSNFTENDKSINLAIDENYKDAYSITNLNYKKVEPKPEVLNLALQYYIYDNEKAAYIPYIQTEVPNEDLYTRYTKLYIKPEEDVAENARVDVVGKYYVEAVNSTLSPETKIEEFIVIYYPDETSFNSDGRDKYVKDGINYILYEGSFDESVEYYFKKETIKQFNNTTTPVSSNVCIVPAPQEIKIKGDNLPNHKFLDDNNNAILTFDLEKDTTNPTREFSWYYSVDNNNPMSNEDNKLDTQDTMSYKVENAPGWYQVHIDSILNRKVEALNTNICRVTKKPQAPVVEKMSFYSFDHGASEDEIEDAIENKIWTIAWKNEEDFSPVPMPEDFGYGGIALLKVETDLDIDENGQFNPLLSDGLRYEWYVQQSDSNEPRLLTESDIHNNGLIHQSTTSLNTNIIAVRCVADGFAYNYFCKITNNIANSNIPATTDTSKLYTFTIK